VGKADILVNIMIIKSKNRLPLLATDKLDHLPVLPLRTGVLFPGAILTIHVGRSDSLELIKYCQVNKKQFVAAYSPTPSKNSDTSHLHQVGCLAYIRNSKKGPGESVLVTIEGAERVSISEIIEVQPFITASVCYLQQPKSVAGVELKNKIDDLNIIVDQITQLDPTYSPEQLHILKIDQKDPSILADMAASIFHFPLASQQELLETFNLKQRFVQLLFHLNLELDKAATIHNINKNAKKAVEEEQRKLYLRQQLHEIRKQLGEDYSEEKEAARLRNIIKNSPHLPPEMVSRALIEADRLSQIPTASAEFGVTKNYLDWILSLPWQKSSPEDYDIREAEAVLSSHYYGPSNIKEPVLQRLSVRKLMGGGNEGPTLCLVGAHGTGKASLAKAIALALGKEFIRISVGGIADVTEIKGTSRTFLGAMPGKIIRTLRDVGSSDPVILIEDIDYFNIDNDSSVNMALLEVIDNRKNDKFLDNYLGVPFDLSKIFFICSVRSFEEIPEQFLPRMELLEFPGYIEREKIVISKRYMIPSLLKKHGIAKSELKFDDKILSKIINNYTQEAGLLAFSQQIEKICRKVALKKAEKGKNTWHITEKNLETFLGQALFIPEKAETSPEIGTAAGLAWTGAGGDLMFIEGLKMKGEGQIITTGSLGDVMRESIQAAHSYVRSKADVLGIDFNDFNEFDIHIHFPSGAIPKDGPSAGVTVSLVVASVMSERPIRNDIAMTGEVTLRGRVLPVGGVKEKVSAAYRAGIYNVAIPKENIKDTIELPKEILRRIKFHYIERVDELFELCLLDFTPSSYTLEKIFAEEIEKAKKKKSRTQKKRPKKTTPKAAKTKIKSKPKSKDTTE